MQRKCSGTNKSGHKCQSPALGDSLYCIHHCPNATEERRALHAAGGTARSNANRARSRLPSDLQAIATALMKAVEDVQADKLPPSRATAIASLASAYIRLYETGTLSVRLQDIEDRLENLATAPSEPLRRVA